ncbi:MAG TPA: YggS family pyridoxal phosphate-dependent enzyme [Bacteroidales bacterium]|nr:YggS family pyridoxal phosphate-dependent enzyme [Bacteroidales bacterium]HPS16371.1 YggS family pyridoxal phosphate-dependent enzyme [Bacteroidales bacterium]
MSIKENLLKLNEEIPSNVKLIAVSKTNPVEKILEAYQCGQKVFGENRVQELIEKQPKLPDDIEWHFIGHMQSNKVKYIASYISMIHSVESLKLLQEINKEAQKKNRIINCLLEMYIAKEETKFGLDYEEAVAIIESEEYKKMQNIRICGVMGMATFSEDTELVRNEFKDLKTIYHQLKSKYFCEDKYFREISMGMSGDYTIAIEEGSTIVRIGTAIFGER